MEKRQPTQPGTEVCRKRPRAKALNSDDPAFTSTASDEEVEQFFSILRQMHVAKKAAGTGSSTLGIGDRSKRHGEKGNELDDWTPAFRLEDFALDRTGAPRKKGGADEGSSSGERGERREKQRPLRGTGISFDLNADPEPDGVPA